MSEKNLTPDDKLQTQASIEESELAVEEDEYIQAKIKMLEREREVDAQLEHLQQTRLNAVKRAQLYSRFKNLVMFGPIIVGAAMLILPFDYLYELLYLNKRAMNIMAILLVSISVFSMMLHYLQTGFSKNKSLDKDYVITKNNIIYHNSEKKATIDDINSAYQLYKSSTDAEIEKLKSKIEDLTSAYKNKAQEYEKIPFPQREEIIESLKKKLINEAYKEAGLTILNKIERDISKNNKSDSIDEVFNKNLFRLKQETESLGRRGNLNLLLGIFTTVIGLLLLGYFVIETKVIPEDKLTFLASFIPRLSLVILIEIFAYFFLKLYKASLSEIKYFQNEMTNMEAKHAAIQCAKYVDDKTAFSNIIKGLTSTERNALLEKSQTTAEIEMAKIENKNISLISEKVMSFINNRKEAN